jgi:hypothetical protein
MERFPIAPALAGVGKAAACAVRAAALAFPLVAPLAALAQTDTIPPTVAISSPANGATVSGFITVTAAASDNVGVVGVQFKYSGAGGSGNLGEAGGVEDTAAPYSAPAFTNNVPNGSYALTAVARDAAGNVTTSAPVTITIANGLYPGPRFPRLGAYPIGGLADYESDYFRTRAPKYHALILTQWPGWQFGTRLHPETGLHWTMAEVMQDIKARSNVGTRMFIYVNNNEMSDPTNSGDAYFPVWRKLNDEHWWLYPAGTTGVPVRSTFSNAQGIVNNTKITPTLPPTDAAGKTWIQWKADFDYGFDVVGDANNAPNDFVDGFFMDNVFWAPRVRGDWDRDGVNDCNELDTFHPCNATVAGWLRDGYKSYFDYIRSVWPNSTGTVGVHIGNIADWGNPGANIGVLDQVLEGGVMEGMIGEDWSVETQSGFTSMMAWYRKMIDATRAPKLAIFGQDRWASGDYRGMRYGLASTLMDDAYYYISSTDGNGNASYDPNNLLWFDEFDFNLGYPTQPRQTAQWSQGVWRRDFDNGIVLVNPKGNPAQTVNLGGTFRKLVGSPNQDPVTNNGATVTSVTLAERDGIILRR